MGGGGGGVVQDVARAAAAAATGGASEVILDKVVTPGSKKSLGISPRKGFLTKSVNIATPAGGKEFTERQITKREREKEKVAKAFSELSERQESLLASQQRAVREARDRETRTRRRAQAQARKRLALGFLAGKQGTVKTGALGLQNPASIARRTLGVV